MGQLQTAPSNLFVTSDELEIVDAGDNLVLAILTFKNAEDRLFLTLSQEQSEVLNKDDVYIWFDKLIESILLVANSEGALDFKSSILDVISLSASHKPSVLTAEVHHFDDSLSSFVPASWLSDKIKSVANDIPSNQDPQTQKVLTRILRILQFLKRKTSDESLNHESEVSPIVSRRLLRDYFGQYQFSKDLKPFDISWEEYESSREVQYTMAYRLMRGYVPPYLLENYLNRQDDHRIERMLNDGLPLPLCHRLLHYKVLWLLCMHQNDILQIPFSFLNNHTAFEGLDTIELSALYYHLPKWKDLARFIWLARLKLHLDHLVFQEKFQGIEGDLVRHSVYDDDSLQYFDPDAPIQSSVVAMATLESVFALAEEELPLLSPTEVVPEQTQPERPITPEVSQVEATTSVVALEQTQPERPISPEEPQDILKTASSESSSSQEFPSLATQETYGSDMFPMHTALFSLESLSNDHFHRKPSHTQASAQRKPSALHTTDEEEDEEYDEGENDLLGNESDGEEVFMYKEEENPENFFNSSSSSALDNESELVNPPGMKQETQEKFASFRGSSASEYEYREEGSTNSVSNTVSEPPVPLKQTEAEGISETVATETAIPLSFVDFDLMPDQPLLLTLEEIKRKSYQLNRISRDAEDDKVCVVGKERSIISNAEEGEEEEEDLDGFDTEKQLMRTPFNVRPQLERENTFIATMKDSMMSIVRRPDNVRDETMPKKLERPSSSSSPSSPLPSPRTPRVFLNRQSGHIDNPPALSTSLSFLVQANNGSSKTPNGKSIPSSPSHSSKTSPNEHGKYPTTSTQSTLLTLQQDMRRVAHEVGDEFGDDAVDLVAALALSTINHRRHDDGWYDEIPSVTHEVDLDVDEEYNGDEEALEENALAGVLEEHRGTLDEYEHELTSFIDAQRRLSPLGSSNNLQSPASASSSSSTHQQLQAGSRVNSGQRLSLTRGHTQQLTGSHPNSASSNRSFFRRRNLLTENVSVCLNEFLSDTDQVPTNSEASKELMKGRSKETSPSSETFEDRVEQRTPSTSLQRNEEIWSVLQQEADEFYRHLTKQHALERQEESDLWKEDGDRLIADYWQEEKDGDRWSRFTASLTAESRSDATYESMVHEYIVELIVTGDIEKAENMLRQEPSVVIPISKANQLLMSMLLHYDSALTEKRTTADPPSIEIILFLQNRLKAQVHTNPDMKSLVQKYYGDAGIVKTL